MNTRIYGDGPVSLHPEEDRSLGRKRAAIYAALALFAIALAIRLAALPFSTFDSADSASRVWLAWEWLEHPFLITQGVWEPLDFYLIGAALWIWPDPVASPIALHIILGALVPVVIYFIAVEQFGSRRGALAAGLAFCVYPTAIAISILPRSETPFIMFLGLGILFLARARRPERRIREAILAGVCVGLASMLRYEAWFLMPFLVVLLLDRPKQAVAFLVPALIHPVFWMAGNLFAHSDPFYGIDVAARENREASGHHLSLHGSVNTLRQFVRVTAVALSVPLTLAIVAAVATGLTRRTKAVIWLLPPAALFVMLAGSAANGGLFVKWQYTATFGLLLMPWVAYALITLGCDNWPTRTYALACTGFVLVIALCTVEPLWRDIPGGQKLYSPAVARFPEQEATRHLQRLVARSPLRGKDALVTDFIGWMPTGYLALHTKLKPSKICAPRGSTHDPVDVGGVQSFLRKNPHGILVTRDQGRLGSLFQFGPDSSADLDGFVVHLQPLGQVPWRGGDDRPASTKGTVSVARYSLTSIPQGYQPPRCPASCTIQLVEACAK